MTNIGLHSPPLFRRHLTQSDIGRAGGKVGSTLAVSPVSRFQAPRPAIYQAPASHSVLFQTPPLPRQHCIKPRRPKESIAKRGEGTKEGPEVFYVYISWKWNRMSYLPDSFSYNDWL
jgi:hypothetical protein